MDDVRRLYEQLSALRSPDLAGRVGDFALYESLLAGCADRVARGGLLDTSMVPKPDEDTLGYVQTLRAKAMKTPQEKEFLAYFDLLERIRSTLSGS